MHEKLDKAASASDILEASGAMTLLGGPSFSLRNRLYRATWNAVWIIGASWTPSKCYPWRRLLLRLFGATLGEYSDVRGSARVWDPSALIMGKRALIGPNVICYNMATVTLGNHALVSQGAHLCAGSHDVDDANFQLIAGSIRISDYAWIAAEAFIGPGVTVAEGAVLGARAVTFSDLLPWSVYSGNPARLMRQRSKAIAIGKTSD